MVKGKSLTKNSIYYVVYNTLNILFPFLTGIYVSQVLFPNDIGTIRYAQNIAQYFVILSFLGIPTYGMREISKARDNRLEVNRIFSELYIINFISTVIFVLCYCILIFSIPQFRENIIIYLIVGGSIALNVFNISFLYDGLEEFKFTSLRNISFKAIVFILLLLMVKEPTDYLWYAAITVFGTAGNYIINMLHSKRFVTFSYQSLNFKRHIKPIMLLVAVNLAIEIYSLVDVTMIGNICSKDHVAFYSYGHNIQRILLQVINSFTIVIVPRITFYYKEGKIENFNMLLTKTLYVIMVLSSAMILGLFFTADKFIVLLYGNSYTNSSKVLLILSVLLLISPIGYLLGSRVLLAVGKENLMAVCVAIGAIVNVITNWFLIPKYAEFGAAYASVVSEFIVMSIYIWFGKRYFHLTHLFIEIRKIIIALTVMCITLYILTKFHMPVVIELVLDVVLASGIYFALLLVQKETIVIEYFTKMKAKIMRTKNL
jgi:O-antigen/teichoic acid export membrane protein